MNNGTILIGLNEINFDFLENYIQKGDLPHFAQYFGASKLVKTHSEKEYKLLEPWIQWVTVYTGKTYEEHQIFRLGDIVGRNDLSQIFEEIEDAGVSVAAISPFNAENRLKKSPFFVPDPWTKTKVTGSWFINNFYNAIHQSVNDNDQEKIKLSSLLALGAAFLFFVPIKSWGTYLKNIKNRKKPGTKAVVLDNLLCDVFYKLWKKKRPGFSNLFLNSGAHIQHHYLFISQAYNGELTNPEWYCPKGYDPLLKILKVYDNLLGRLSKHKNVKIMIATGLHQQPHEHITFYWRLKDHNAFLNKIGATQYTRVLPRMSRDFLIEFDSKEKCMQVEALLKSYVSAKDEAIIFDVDNRGDSLFVELVYPNDIKEGDAIKSKLDQKVIPDFLNHVSFVAIKNGEHNGIGYLTSNFDLPVSGEIPLTQVRDIILKEAIS